MPGLWQLQSWQLPVFTNRGKGRREGGKDETETEIEGDSRWRCCPRRQIILASPLQTITPPDNKPLADTIGAN